MPFGDIGTPRTTSKAAVDDRIAARLQNTGTPTKTFMGYEATGARVNFMEFASYKVRDGRFAEMWFLMDSATVAEQLRG